MSQEQRSLLGDISRLLLSGAVSQGIALLLVFVIGRQYSQEAMGIQGLILSWSGLLIIAIMGRYEQTIVIAPSDKRAVRLWHICLLLAATGSIAIGFTTLLLLSFWKTNPLGSFILWIAPFVFVMSTISATMMLLLRRKEYTRLGISQGLRTISNNLIKVLLGIHYPTSLSLIASTVGASLIGAIPLAKTLRQALPLRWDRRYIVYLKHYIDFPLFSTPQALLNTISGSLLVLMLPLGYGLREVGLITMVMMLVRRPMIVLSDSVGQVYFERMSRQIGGRASALPLIRKLILATLVLGLAACILVYCLVERAVPLLLGDGWGQLPHIIVCMLPYLLVNFVASILNVLPDILGRQKVDLLVRIIGLGIEASAILAGMQYYPFEKFVGYYYLLLFVLELLYIAFLIQLFCRHQAPQ